jgi:hypothetical protein
LLGEYGAGEKQERCEKSVHGAFLVYGLVLVDFGGVKGSLVYSIRVAEIRQPSSSEKSRVFCDGLICAANLLTLILC